MHNCEGTICTLKERAHYCIQITSIGMNKIFHKTLILCGHPLKRMVGIMMRPQRAERATIICSVGSWDPTIVPTPDSTEGNYFRITTRSAAAARSSSSSSSKQQHFAAAAAAVSAAVEAADSVVATVSSHRPQLKLLRCMEQSGKQLSIEQQRTVEENSLLKFGENKRVENLREWHQVPK